MENTNLVSSIPSKSLYKVAAVMAILIVAAGLTDAVTSMGIAAQDNRIIPIVEWFSVFQTGGFEAFSRLGVINMITLSLSIPIYLAFMQHFRREHAVLAALAPIVFFIGTAVYLSSNTVFVLFAVSRQYATASTMQKPLLEAAGQALLAQGADLTPGTFVGLFLTQIAGLLMTGTMLQGSLFGKWTGWFGVLGFGLMVVFFILTAFFPAHYDAAMMVAAPGALTMIAYQILLARKFFQLGR